MTAESFPKANRVNAYSTDASGLWGIALDVFSPQDESELRSVVLKNPYITIRGGGSGVVGGAVPDSSVIVDLSRMNKIIDVDPVRRIVTVESGIVLSDLNSALSAHGLEFPLDPLSSSICTIGGMIATNASGPRSAKHKRMADSVVELEIMDSRGEIVKLSRIDASNAVGMEGITGIIVRAKIKVITKPIRSLSVYRSVDMFKIIELVRKVKVDSEVSMIHLLSPSLSQIMGLDRINHLFIEYESDKGDIKGELYNERIGIIRNIYNNSSSAGFTRVEDCRVFLDKILELSSYLDSVKVPYHANLGTGIVNPIFLTDDYKGVENLHLFVKRMRGSVYGSMGMGRVKKEYMDINDKKLAQRIKKRYDPTNKFNRGVIVNIDDRLDLHTKEHVSEMIATIDAQEAKKEDERIRKLIEERGVNND
jgi:FAD/FMN-containing dehydrogenase